MSDGPALNPPLRGAGRKPDWRFLVAHPAHPFALGFGSGLSPVAPGTAGTLFAWLIWAQFLPETSEPMRALVLLFRFFDAVKPGPVAWADQRFKLRRGKSLGWAQGFGILFDDVVAALCTVFLIAVWRFV